MHVCRGDKIARMLTRVPSEQEITTIALVDLLTKQNEHYPLSYISLLPKNRACLLRFSASSCVRATVLSASEPT